MKTRYWKVLRDLTSDYAKNAMLVLAIAIGVFGIGAILGGYSVVKREMTDNYMSTVPASATIELEENISKELVDSVKQWPGIQEVERHATLLARMKVGDKWYPLLLFIIDDFANKKTNLISYQSGERAPATGSILVERTALVVMEAKEGDELMVKIPNGQPLQVKISGTVHDPGLAPAWQEQTGYGYITMSTLRALGGTQEFDQLRILVSEQKSSREHITNKAQEVASMLTKGGHHVHEIQVPPPGKHPHQSQMSSVMRLFVVFAFLVLILGSILVATSMATLMMKQVRQIGVMKTVGARSAQVMGIYILMVFVLCIVAAAIAIPLSWLAATGFYNQIAVLLNLEIRDNTIPVWVAVVQLAAGIVIPLLATFFPVMRGARVSVRKALDNFGVALKDQGRSSIVRLFQFGGEIFQLSVRNVFRQRSRLAMTLGLLAAGGAMFMTALNVRKAWEKNLARIYEQRLYDTEFRLSSPPTSDTVLTKIRQVPGITVVEAWNSSPASFKTDNSFEVTRTYPDGGHGSFTVQAVPIPTQLLRPTLRDGRWLTSDGEANDVVLNQLALGHLAGVKIGDKISLSVDGQLSRWHVVGFTEDVGTPATAYVSLDAYKQKVSQNPSKVLRIAYADRSKANAVQKNKEIEALLAKENISISSTIPVWLLHNAIAGHMKVLVNSLMALAVLMALVGIIGLMSTMSMSVLERTREMGVMRAIGATPKKIRALVTWEGLLIGTFSIFIAFATSLLLSIYMGRMIGNMAFRTPLSLSISLMALGVWIALIIIGSFLATLYPAKRASSITTREALAYE